MSIEKKDVVIIVEATEHLWPKGEISYDEVVKLEFPNHDESSDIRYSVKYKRGHGNKPEGILSPGATVRVKNRMVFNVTKTGQS